MSGRANGRFLLFPKRNDALEAGQHDSVLTNCIDRSLPPDLAPY